MTQEIRLLSHTSRFLFTSRAGARLRFLAPPFRVASSQQRMTFAECRWSVSLLSIPSSSIKFIDFLLYQKLHSLSYIIEAIYYMVGPRAKETLHYQ